MECDRKMALDLLRAARDGELDVVMALLPASGDLAEDGLPHASGGLTPLMAAAANGHVAVVDVVVVEVERAGAIGRKDLDHVAESLAQRIEQCVVGLGAHRDDAARTSGCLQRGAGERSAATRARRAAVDDVDGQVPQDGHTVDKVSRHRLISWHLSALKTPWDTKW